MDFILLAFYSCFCSELCLSFLQAVGFVFENGVNKILLNSVSRSLLLNLPQISFEVDLIWDELIAMCCCFLWLA